MILPNMDLTYPITDRGAGTRYRDRRLRGHLLKGNDSQLIKPELATDQSAELDVREKAA